MIKSAIIDGNRLEQRLDQQNGNGFARELLKYQAFISTLTQIRDYMGNPSVL